MEIDIVVEERGEEDPLSKLNAVMTTEACLKIATSFAALPFGTSITTDTNLIMTETSVGKGPCPNAGQQITVRYRGQLDRDGGSFRKGLLTLKVGTNGKILGFEEGVRTMRTGGKRVMEIPCHLAYGAEEKGENATRRN